jgi:hypothetical protein
MVNLSVSLANLDEKQIKIWEALLEQLKTDSFWREEITTFVLTHNEGLADTVKNEQSETKVCWGEGVIYEILNFSR